jgi:hypothetical protein
VLAGATPAASPVLHLFSVVDDDPSGYWIEREFAAQLQAFGVEDVTLHTLIRSARLIAEQVRPGRYSLPKGSKTTNWRRATEGIDGEPPAGKRMLSLQRPSGRPLSKRPRLLCARHAR